MGNNNNVLDYYDFNRISTLFNNLKDAGFVFERSKPETFMEVAGYPHYENVCSNILAFFFNPQNPHGFNDLFIKTLILAIKLKAQGGHNKEVKEILADIDEFTQFDNAEPEREVITDSKNRIDLIITTSNYIIGIENKIFSGCGNDLEDYKNLVNNKAENLTPLCILLTLNDESKIARQHGFINIRYVEWFDMIKREIGKSILKADSAWTIYLRDFINTIEALEEKRMDIELAKFFSKNINEIKFFEEAKRNLKKQLSNEADTLKSSIDIKGIEKSTWFSRDIPCSCFVSLRGVMEIELIVIEALYDLSGVHIIIQTRPDNKDFEKLYAFLKDNSLLNSQNEHTYSEDYLTLNYYDYEHYTLQEVTDTFISIILRITA